jgi:ferredoxin-type protein NapH
MIPLFLWIAFAAVAIVLWTCTADTFYLFNFLYIGSCLAVCTLLYGRGIPAARNLVELAVGLYMLIYLGLMSGENMQIEGFWFYLFSGTFEAAVIHYAVAKIFGPLLFGRGWCGYACWTAMVLDLLPFKEPQRPKKGIGWLRYVVFVGSFLFVGALFALKIEDTGQIMFWSFVVGNIAYYATGIGLAFALHDNRAFCKYVCPITVFLRPMSSRSLLHIKCDTGACIQCGRCQKVCPMNIDPANVLLDRQNRSDCILCLKCIEECPKKALKM